MSSLNKTKKKVTHFLAKTIAYVQVDEEKKKGKQRNWMKKEKKKGKAIDVDETHMQVHVNNFVYFKEKPFWWSHGRKQIPPHFFFPTKHSIKHLSLHFSLLNLSSSLKSIQTNIG